MSDPLNPDAPKVDEETLKKALELSEKEKVREVNIACRRAGHLEDGRAGASSGDADLRHAKCESNRAQVISDLMPGAGNIMYKCVDCGYTWNVSMGGRFSY